MSKNKRAPLPRQVAYTKEFQKSWKKHNKAGRSNMQELRQVMTCLFYGEQLADVYRPHPLIGNWAGFNECHIGGDFLLIYKETETLVTFVDIGTHSELFG